MRLTLRTLLAYLDTTLDPADAQILRSKLEQSGFATQLVQNIRASLAAKNLSAPAPDSVHPVEEPNMMSDFLDSTLSPEQIAEVEKACLESLPHLAEAAACHQILTMVLGRPAGVSEDLKNRIYSMVDEHGNVKPSPPVSSQLEESKPGVAFGSAPPVTGEIGPRFSNIDVGENSVSALNPADVPTSVDAKSELSSDDQPTIGLTEAAAMESAGPSQQTQDHVSSSASAPTHIRPTPPAPADKIQPVGADDSGVFEAANILREQSQQFAEAGTALDDAEPFAGNLPLKELERSDFYEGSVRPSRITPWLVSLALVGALLFAISQIFAPLLNPKVAQKEEEKASDSLNEIPLNPNETSDQETQTAVAAELDANPSADAAKSNSGTPKPTVPSPKSDAADATGTDLAETMPDELDATQSETPDTENEDSESVAAPEASTPAASTPEEMIAMIPKVASESVGALPAAPSKADLPNDKSAPTMDSAEGQIATDTMNESETPVGVGDDPGMEPEQPAERIQVATLNSESVFFATRSQDKPWILAAPASALMSGDTLVCGPEFRAELSVAADPDCKLTLVGPTQLTLVQQENELAIVPSFGKGLIQVPQAGKTLQFVIDEQSLNLTVESDSTTVAFALNRKRELGDDPNVPQNHTATVQLLALAGKFTVNAAENEFTLGNSQQTRIEISETGFQVGEPEKFDTMPSWCDPESDTGTLESDAAADLLELIRTDEADSLLLSLKVALGFRRNEVAALAGKTMLAMDDASAYFGVDGLLSNPKQRLYWASHLSAIRAMVDRSAESAQAVRTAIAGQNQAIDDADGDTLFRLLVGYSADQLSNGGDAELVEGLESASVPVRVLASEHLREISGTTLFFKPEETVEARREEIIKKWKVRLRKEAIRWPDQ